MTGEGKLVDATLSNQRRARDRRPLAVPDERKRIQWGGGL